MQYYKCFHYAHDPVYATEGSACFDLKALVTTALPPIKAYNERNEFVELRVNRNEVSIPPKHRALIPTGLIFDLHQDHSVRLHPRSGLSLKKGVILANCEGIIDSDYIEPVYIILLNISDESVIIKDGDRICQGEEFQDYPKGFLRETKEKPTRENEHGKGFGGTGE